jgi:hypothetical protein
MKDLRRLSADKPADKRTARYIERLARIAAGLPPSEDGSGPVPTITEQLHAIEVLIELWKCEQ